MKALTILVLCCASVVLADDFKTVDGKEYKNATVSRVEPDGIVITFSGGIVKLPFVELPPDVQTKYGYDSKGAATYAAEENQRQVALQCSEKRTRTNEQKKGTNIGVNMRRPLRSQWRQLSGNRLLLRWEEALSISAFPGHK